MTAFISKMTCNMMGSSEQAQWHNQSCSLSAGHCILEQVKIPVNLHGCTHKQFSKEKNMKTVFSSVPNNKMNTSDQNSFLKVGQKYPFMITSALVS